MSDGPGHRILVVDDDADIRASLAQLLEAEVPGVEVQSAADATDGLRLLGEQPFDLIISDYVMPGTDGLEFLQQARQVQADIPAVLLTAYPDPHLAARAVSQVGVVIAKPLDLDYLVAIAHAAVGGRLRRRAG